MAFIPIFTCINALWMHNEGQTDQSLFKSKQCSAIRCYIFSFFLRIGKLFVLFMCFIIIFIFTLIRRNKRDIYSYLTMGYLKLVQKLKMESFKNTISDDSDCSANLWKFQFPNTNTSISSWFLFKDYKFVSRHFNIKVN